MRVYEIAKKYGVSSKEMLEVLKKAGIKLPSHMSVVPEDGIECAKKAFAKKAPEKKAKVSAEKAAPVPKQEKPTKKEVLPEKKQEVKEKKIAIQKQAPKAKVIPKKPVRKEFVKRHKRPFLEKKVVTQVSVDKSMPLFQVADMMGKPCGDLILVLLKKGMACNRNHVLPVDVICMLAETFGISVVRKDEPAEMHEAAALKKDAKGAGRWPIVVVMGHVDHGKTTLLDYLRKMNVAAKEKGGITQHVGAYEVDSAHGKIVFLDTPGHEAFHYLRAKGARVTDIAVLIVAADDGVKPQTIEAIKHAKQAEVPIIVAINKIDKVEGTAALQTVKRQLAEQGLVVEDWGGDIICVPISAKTGQGVDELLEMLVLQAQMMELKAEKEKSARAFVLESELEKGHGPVATVLSIEGTIKKGDYFVCGTSTGRVRLLINSFDEKINQAGPAVPVRVVGFDSFEGIGDWLNVIPREEYLKIKSKGIESLAPAREPVFAGTAAEQEFLKLIIKVDTRGSKEAIEGSISKIVKKLKKGEKPFKIIQCSLGDISEGDIELADTTKAIVLGMHVKAERNALNFAKEKGVEVKTFDIIYKMVEFLEELVEKTKEIEVVWNKTGTLVVKKVFNIKKIGIIAGCGVQEGICKKDSKVVCVRAGKKVGEGKISSLQKEGKVVKEVHSGQECGFVCDQFSDWQEGDIVECYSQEKQ